jgi:hypothetical protein
LTTVLILTIAISSLAILVPTTTAEEWPYVKGYPWIGAVPNPVGVGQDVLFAVVTTTALRSQTDGWSGLWIEIERPDGKVDKITDIRTDSTGNTGRMYVPSVVGTHYVTLFFPEQPPPQYGGFALPEPAIVADAQSEVLELVVQEEPVPGFPGFPLPAEYWTRPINAMLHEWSPVAGNWLNWPVGGYAVGNEDAPESAHILWTKPIDIGGLSGAELGAQSFEDGAAYETKFRDTIILGGILYYRPRESRLPVRRVTAVDLRTGEEKWNKELIAPDGFRCDLAFGQLFYWDSYNYHGVHPYLWGTDGSTWHAFDADTGDWYYTYEDVPSGFQAYGDKGEIYIYTLDIEERWMSLWNSSRVVSSRGSWRPGGRTWDATRGIEWNVTIPEDIVGEITYAKPGEYILGRNGTSFARTGPVSQMRVWKIDVSEGHEGRVMFNEAMVPPDPVIASRQWFTFVSEDAGAFCFYIVTTKQWAGFSLDTGKHIWLTTPQHALDVEEWRTVYDGKLYTMGYGGIIHCYDMTDGTLLWKHGISDPYNENLFGLYWGTYDKLFSADGKIYTCYSEHSPIDPKPRGAPFQAIDAQTGELIFRIDSVFHGYYHGCRNFMIGDSIVVLHNAYDNQVYAFGKGPSQTTVAMSYTGDGSSVMVQGTVTDVSPGTEAANRKLRFPNGVPAVSDESMSHWMQYVYQQFPRPTNATGVEVVINVLDPNGNYYEVGRTTADADGFFKLSFEPPVPGEYTVIACFEGSKSYWPSHAKTAFSVAEAPAATPAPTPAPASIADTYFVPATAGIIIAIVIVGAVLILMLRKR